MSLAALIALALVAVVIAFALATADAALVRVSRVRAAELRDEGRIGAGSLERVLADPAPHLAVLAFLRVLVESSTAVLVTYSVAQFVDSEWAIVSAIAVMVLISFILVGVSPRTLGQQHHDSVALVAAPVAAGLRTVLGPVARLLVAVGNAVTPGKGFRDGPFASEAELRDLVDLAGESAVIDAAERAMIQQVFELGDTIAREVMVPRTEMVTLESGKSLRSAMSLFMRTGFSRIPVVGEDNDDVLGLLYLKDVTRRVMADPEAGAALEVSELMRPMAFVPESKRVDELLRDMQRDQTHLEVVVDEYGGTAGLITIEDILEEIVGEITDEYDRETPGIERLAGGAVRLPATTDIDDLADLFGVTIEEDHVDTIGGLLTKLIGRVAIPGASAQVAGLRLTAERMAGRRHQLATVIVEPVVVPDGEEHAESAPGTPLGSPDNQQEATS